MTTLKKFKSVTVAAAVSLVLAGAGTANATGMSGMGGMGGMSGMH